MKKVLLILLLAGLSHLVNAQEAFEVVIDRQVSNSNCTMGYLSVNGEIISYTLELPWVENKSYISSIPEGTYNGYLRYDKSDGWRIQLDNVPDRTGVQIHIGNYTSQIKGCTLVGLDANVERCEVYQSKEAYTKFKSTFYGNSDPIMSPDKVITVTFQ